MDGRNGSVKMDTPTTQTEEGTVVPCSSAMLTRVPDGGKLMGKPPFSLSFRHGGLKVMWEVVAKRKHDKKTYREKTNKRRAKKYIEENIKRNSICRKATKAPVLLASSWNWHPGHNLSDCLQVDIRNQIPGQQAERQGDFPSFE